MNWNWKESAEDIFGILIIAAFACVIVWIIR